MATTASTLRLSDLFRSWSAPVRFIGAPEDPDPEIAGVSIWEPDGSIPTGSLAIAQRPNTTSARDAFFEDLHASHVNAWMLVGWEPEDLQAISDENSAAAIAIAPAHISTTMAVESVLRFTLDPTTAELRRLTSLQRSFAQELNSDTPTQAILERLQRICNAVALVVTANGTVRESTGQIPLRQVLEQLQKTDAPSQYIGTADWSGQAIRLQVADASHTLPGWLVVASRREGFPDTSTAAAIHIAASLIETVQRVNSQARSQEEAVRTSLFEQALSIKPQREYPELESRIAALGFTYDSPLRVVVAAPTRSAPQASRRSLLEESYGLFTQLLDEAEVLSLSTRREDGAVYLVQASEATLTRVIRSHRDKLSERLFGLGRNINNVTETFDSYADAWLGIRTLRSRSNPTSHISFEQFDFATRLFANVGIDVMSDWSREYLGPLLERDQILIGLRQYFHHAQNIAAAADALGIHHNSLRYRLTKVEELLDVSLRDPAVISSLFLALTSLDLATLSMPGALVREANTASPHPAPDNAARFGAESIENQKLGVTLSPSSMRNPRASDHP
ncbi:MAG: PucR family transcriptional regulator [Gulosibacter sp.]|uniref:PucR family transcriptional regulator n=1 Tax=Gulosibacter sp. TaxID=2817531 RepID=UPI003F8FCD18